MHFQSRVSTTTVHGPLFADDCALNTTSEEDIQRSMDLFSAACENFGLIINTEKTVVTHQTSPKTTHNAPQISMNGTQLQVVDNFTYLGSILPRSTEIDDKFARRISKARQAVGRLLNAVWDRHDLHPNTKLKMYTADSRPKLPYRAETWTVYKKQAQRLNHSNLICLRQILELSWRDRIPDRNSLERTGIGRNCAMPGQMQLRWGSRLVWMNDERLPRRLCYEDVATGSPRQER
ncbi:hypothetical protein SprV_0301161700 [Sparganum proliferum]